MYLNSIKNLINIKDNNVNIFSVSRDIINNVTSNIVEATLDYKPSHCPKCDTSKPRVLSKGFLTSMIKLNKTAEYNTYLKLKKKRFTCLECNRTFTLSTNVVDKNCFISKDVKLSVMNYLSKALSMKDIASFHNISFSTVARCLNSYDTNKHTIKKYLPPVLLFDEFKSVKNISGKMSFIFLDGTDNSIIDIVENRQLDYLIKYFKYYTKKARNSVKYVVIDMYAPYISLIKKMFKNATIIFDKFHIVQHLNRAFNKTRIDTMNKDKENYNKFKRYWKLILMNRFDLNPVEYKYSMCFRKYMSNSGIVDYLKSTDEIFSNSYDYYQDFLAAIHFKDKDKLEQLIDTVPDDVSYRIKDCIRFIANNKEYVLNSLISSYTNGPIEGINNKIKVIKRIAYGYRSFRNFKTRILLHFNLLKHEKK